MQVKRERVFASSPLLSEGNPVNYVVHSNTALGSTSGALRAHNTNTCKSY